MNKPVTVCIICKEAPVKNSLAFNCQTCDDKQHQLTEKRREAFELFRRLSDLTHDEAVGYIMKLHAEGKKEEIEFLLPIN